MTQKAHSWNAQELRAITRWYGAVAHDPSLPGDEAIVSAIDPMSTNGGTLRTLQSLLDGNTEPQEAAKDLASSILAAEAPTNSWGWMLVAVCRASEFQDQPRLLKLADLTNELSKLPHALPHHPYLPDVRSPDDLKFAELPGFGLTLRESLNGPTQYFSDLIDVTIQARNAAQDRWRNISAFTAVITHYAYIDLLPQSLDFAWMGRVDIVVALESRLAMNKISDQTTKPYINISMERMPSLFLSAAIMWIVLAGRELMQSSADETRKAGPLWAEARGQRLWGDYETDPRRPVEEFSVERWSFWRHRLLEIAESGALGLELTASCEGAATNIAVLIEEVPYQ